MSRSARWATTILVAASLLVGAGAAAAVAPTWRETRQHLPVDRQDDDSYEATPTAVDCATASYCVVAGTYDTNDPFLRHRVFLDTEADGTRTSIAAPLPAGATGRYASIVSDVSCPVVGGCVGVGSYAKGQYTRALVETQLAGRWVPSRVGRNPLDHVDCTPQVCAASGPGEIAGAVFAVRGTDGRWRFPELTAPAGMSFSSVDDVACAGASCYAIATVFPTAGGSIRSALLLPDGTGGFRAVEASAPAGVTDPVRLNALSCRDETTCYAIGQAGPARAEDHLLVEKIAHGTVTVQEPRLPRVAATRPPLAGGRISCADDGICTAIGAYGGSAPEQGTDSGPLLLTLDGAGWHAVVAPVPDGASSADLQLAQVSCAATRCAVVGWVGTHAVRRPVVETYQDGTWSVRELPVPSWLPPSSTTDVGVQLNQVSCSGESCLAAGTFDIYDSTFVVRSGAFLARG